MGKFLVLSPTVVHIIVACVYSVAYFERTVSMKICNLTLFSGLS